MTDKSLSGWGMAEGKTNKLVITCDSWSEAQTVKRNALNRSEMKYVNICYNKPRYREDWYYVNYHDKTDYSGWFKEGAFCDCNKRGQSEEE